MIEHIILEPYDTFGLSTFTIHKETVYIGHFGGMYADDGAKLTTIEDQTVQTFRNLERALASIDLTLEHVLKVTVSLKNIGDFHGMHTGWQQVFPTRYPVRMTITSEFIDDDCLIQIDGTAALMVD